MIKSISSKFNQEQSQMISLLDVEIEPSSPIPPKDVQISIQFLRIGEIDTINEKYYAEICIESRWVEKANINAYDPKVYWNPKIYIENALLDPKEEIIYEIKKFYDMVRVKEIRFVKGFFWEKVIYFIY
jgi:hypothetical protein